jgi:hypothetical protein
VEGVAWVTLVVVISVLLLIGLSACVTILGRSNIHIPFQTALRLSSGTIRRNSTHLAQQRLSESNNYNIRRETTISVEQQASSSPPAYDDTIRHSSIATRTEQQSLLPSYDDFVRGNNETMQTT